MSHPEQAIQLDEPCIELDIAKHSQPKTVSYQMFSTTVQFASETFLGTLWSCTYFCGDALDILSRVGTLEVTVLSG